MARQISRYRIISRLGAGGMGEVWLAEDTQLGRPIALKLLPARFADDEDLVRRFEREARAASALNHPNILTVYEVGQEDGIRFIATEYIEGRTLRQRMNEGPISLGEIISIITQVAAALTAAAAAGLTHRDLKPENIMLRHDGYVKVLDFGLAKLTEEPVSDSAAILSNYETATGILIGTPVYMSPEQARGLKVDGRSDIFSLGSVLYELLTGHKPFDGETSADIVAAVLYRDPLPLSSRTTEIIPDELERILGRMLVKDRAERYQSAQQLLDDLQRLRNRLTAEQRMERTDELATRTFTERDLRDTYATRRKPGDATQINPAPKRRRRRAINSLAVLPFITTGSDSSAGYLSDGLTESIINNLSRLPRLRVMARSTVFRYQGRMADPLAVGRELNVRAVLTGRVMLVEDRIIVRTELVDADDGAQLWSGQYSHPLADVFVIEEEISRGISEQLRLRLTGEEKKRVVRRYTDNSDAYQAYLKGRFYWNQRTPQSLKKAIEAFEQAIAFDPNYALAFAGLADAYSVLGIYSAVSPRMAMARAKAMALRAIEIDESLAEAHTALAGAHVWFEWDWEAAEREFKRAIELNPASAFARHWYASVYLTATEQFDEALHQELQARELEPLSLVINTHLGWICYHARRTDEAVAYYRQALELEANFVPAHFYLGLALAQQEQFDEALAELRLALELSGRGAMIIGGLGYVCARAGRRDEALTLLAELHSASSQKYIAPFYPAMIHLGLDDPDQTFAWLDKSYEERFCWLVWLRTEPMYDGLRADPRFADLVRRVGLAN
ncbi:MAG TPA: protein kinase [Blastocatellia bacterium]|nr:protein kinase [Blastocatellia bacterium]